MVGTRPTSKYGALMLYVQKIKPFNHQRVEFEDFGETSSRALWWEQGTGKTKPTIDSVGRAFAGGEIDALLVVAPKGVDWNWVNDELVIHLGIPFHAHVWKTPSAKTKWHRESVGTVINWKDPAVLPVLVIGYDACKTDEAEKALTAFMKKKRVAMVADEASRIKNFSSKTTKRVLRFSRQAVMSRLLNGTPVADSPFHAYTQGLFVDPNLWKSHGIKGLTAMKATFGVWDKRFDKSGREFPCLIRHRNLGLLHNIVDSIGSRHLKADVLDLPPKLYKKIYFDLSPAQDKMYRALEKDYMAWFGDGSLITADLAIVRQTRLQQICSNYIPADDEGELRMVSEKNPRLDTLFDCIEDIPGQMIIWAKYNIDVELIQRRLMELGETHCVVSASTTDVEREEAKHGFQAGKYRFFVAKPSGAAGRGLTLHAAKTVIYYNNGYVLDDRQQSEDRAHRIGQNSAVLYIDIIGRNTVDEHILDILRKKIVVSSMVMGDNLPQWI